MSGVNYSGALSVDNLVAKDESKIFLLLALIIPVDVKDLKTYEHRVFFFFG